MLCVQDVLRRWHSANPAILDNVRALVRTAADLEQSLLQPRAEIDVAAVGRCVAPPGAEEDATLGAGEAAALEAEEAAT